MGNLGWVLAEQNSPTEVLVFLVVTVAIFLAVAFLLYALIMVLLRPGLPDNIRLHKVLFPSGKQLRENFADYLLALVTSLLLTLTLTTKHNLVQQISNYDMDKISDEQVAQLFDFGLPIELKHEIAAASVNDVVQPMLDAGRVEEAELLVRSIISMGVPKHWLKPSVLLASCFVVALFYLLWLAYRRFKTIRKRPDSAPEYARTFRSLLTLAICVGLLLASALPMTNAGEQMLADSTLGAIAEDAQTRRFPSSVSALISKELKRQREQASYLYCPDCPKTEKTIWEVVKNGSAVPHDLSTRLDTFEQQLDDLSDTSESCQAICEVELEQLRALLQRLQSRLQDIAAGISARDTTIDEQLNDLMSDVAGLRAQFNRYVEESRLAQQRHNRENARMAELNSTAHTTLNRRIEELTAQLRDSLRDMQRKLDQSRAIKTLQSRVSQLEALHREKPQPPQHFVD